MKLFSSFVKYYFTLAILSFCIVCKGQQYSFPVYFEDAIGNKDTLIIGFDVKATHEVDTAFQEINLLGTPLDTAFNVVFSDKNFKPKDYDLVSPATYQLKKQILPRMDTLEVDYSKLSSIVEIDVTCDHWPLKISWDSTLLKAGFYTDVVLTAYHRPGSWGHVGPITGDGAIHEMVNMSSVVYNPNDLCVDRDSLLFLYIGWYNLLSSVRRNVVENTVAIYPNPVNQTMRVQLTNQTLMETVEVINLSGVTLLEVNAINKEAIELDLSELSTGLYQIRIINTDGMSLSHTIQKK